MCSSSDSSNGSAGSDLTRDIKGGGGDRTVGDSVPAEPLAPAIAASHELKLPGMHGEQYLVGDYIAAGGMGGLFECRRIAASGGVHQQVGAVEPLVVKFLLSGSESPSQDFLTEAGALMDLCSSLGGSSISKFIDHGSIKKGELERHASRLPDGEVKQALEAALEDYEDSAVHFFIMSHVKGEDLRDVIKQNLSWQSCTALFKQAISTLALVHRAGFLHRDLKPANLIRSADDHLVVIDFGIARKLSGGECPGNAGTNGYMAPEQYGSSGSIDVRADIYGLCATFVELYLGHRVFKAERRDTGAFGPAEQKQLTTEAMAALEERSIPPAIGALLKRGIAAHRDQRFTSMTLLLEGLEQAEVSIARAKVEARKAEEEIARKRGQQHNAIRLGAMLLALLLIGAVVYRTINSLRRKAVARQEQLDKVAQSLKTDSTRAMHQLARFKDQLPEVAGWTVLAEARRRGIAAVEDHGPSSYTAFAFCGASGPVAMMQDDGNLWLQAPGNTRPPSKPFAPGLGRVTSLDCVSYDKAYQVAYARQGQFGLLGFKWRAGASTGLKVLHSEASFNVETVALHPTQALVAVAGSGGHVWLYGKDRGALKLVDKLPLEVKAKAFVRDLDFSPGGEFLAAAVRNGTVLVWRVSDSKEIYRYPDLNRDIALRARGEARTVTFGPTVFGARPWLVSGDEHGGIALHDLATGTTRWITRPAKEGTTSAPITSLVVSPDGYTLAAAERHLGVALFSVFGERLTEQPSWHLLHRGAMALDFAPDGKQLASLGVSMEQGRQAIRTWNLDRRRDPRQNDLFIAADKPVLALSSEGKVLAWAQSQQAKINLLDLDTRKSHGGPALPSDIPEDEGITSLAVFGRLLAAGTQKGKLHIWDRLSPRDEPRSVSVGGDAAVSRVSFAPAGVYLAALSRGQLKLWSVTSTAPQKLSHQFPPGVTAIAWRLVSGANHLALLAVGTKEGEVLLWRKATGVQALRPAGPRGVTSVAFSQGGAHLVSVDDSCKVTRWDPASGRHLDSKILAGCRNLTAAGLGPRGQVLVSGHESTADNKTSGSLKLWDLRSGKQLGVTLGPLGSSVTHVVMSGKVLAAASNDWGVGLWTPPLGRPGSSAARMLKPWLPRVSSTPPK